MKASLQQEWTSDSPRIRKVQRTVLGPRASKD